MWFFPSWKRPCYAFAPAPAPDRARDAPSKTAWYRKCAHRPFQLALNAAQTRPGDQATFRDVPLRLLQGFKYGRIRLEWLARDETALKPLLVYIPGIDGTGLGIVQQVPTLHNSYDVASVVVPQTDRSDWIAMASRVTELIRRECAAGRKATLVAESMGGVLAAIILQQNHVECIERAVLVNPATSYTRLPEPLLSFWPGQTQLPDALYNLVPILAFPLVVDPLQALRRPRLAIDSLRRTMRLTEILSKEAFAHRLDMLKASLPFVSDEGLQKISTPVTVVASANDALIPSFKESQRLLHLIPGALRYGVTAGGHSLLQSPDVLDLSEVLKIGEKTPCSSRPATRKEVDQVLEARNIPDVERPRRRINFLRRLVSPVFVGMERVPRGRPIVFVGNHTLLGMVDIPLLVNHILETRGVLVRGMAHPWLFPAEQPGNAFAPGLDLVGAVAVSPRNMYRLLRQGESVLLFPGGAREAYKRKNERYRLFWPERQEFIRMALRFDAVLVPVGSVGVEDSLDIIADGPELLDTPIVGDQLRAYLGRAVEEIGKSPDPRFWLESDEESKYDALSNMVTPFVRLKEVHRQYFGFGRAWDVRALWKEHCRQKNIRDPTPLDERRFAGSLYGEVKGDLEAVLDGLLEQRQRDPFGDTAKRLAFESLMQCQAPSAWKLQSSDGYFGD